MTSQKGKTETSFVHMRNDLSESPWWNEQDVKALHFDAMISKEAIISYFGEKVGSEASCTKVKDGRCYAQKTV